MCVYVIIVSWPAGWSMQCAHAQSLRNTLCIAEISTGLTSYLSTGSLYSKRSCTTLISIRNRCFVAYSVL